MNEDESLFFGMSFIEGVENLPGDLIISLDSIRDWAFETGLIWDPGQVLDHERAAEIAKVCSTEDKLNIGISLVSDRGFSDLCREPVHAS